MMSAAPVAISTLVAATPTTTDTPASAGGEGGFSAALAAAVAPAVAGALGDGSEELPPAGMESVAALAFIAGLMGRAPVSTNAQVSASGEAGVLTGAAAKPATANADAMHSVLQRLQSALGELTGSGAETAEAPATATDALPEMDAAARALSAGLMPAQNAAKKIETMRAPGSAALPGAQPDAVALQGAVQGAVSETPDAMDALARMMAALPAQGMAASETSVEPASPSTLSGLYVATRDQVAGQVATPLQNSDVRSTVGSPRWADELGSRLVWMSLRGQQEGSLSLSPDHLGPLDVRISVNQDSTNVWFGAAQADTRAALAEALPRLREMFAAAGLSLGQADVSQQASRQQSQAAEAAAALRDGATPASDDVEIVTAAPAQRLRSLLVDTYA